MFYHKICETDFYLFEAATVTSVNLGLLNVQCVKKIQKLQIHPIGRTRWTADPWNPGSCEPMYCEVVVRFQMFATKLAVVCSASQFRYV
jgi:hypothetical protein